MIKSLSRQAAGLAATIVTENYPYTKILEPGLTAVDGAIANFYLQDHHFKIDEMNIPPAVPELVSNVNFRNTHYILVNTGSTYESAGVLSTFGYLRRYEKNRTRANQLYERFLCRRFTSALPKVFPADPGNLRTTAGCSGCHATLDPLADFFKTWGEGAALYGAGQSAVSTSFGGHSGTYMADLADIISNDSAFATCTVCL